MLLARQARARGLQRLDGERRLEREERRRDRDGERREHAQGQRAARQKRRAHRKERPVGGDIEIDRRDRDRRAERASGRRQRQRFGQDAPDDAAAREAQRPQDRDVAPLRFDGEVERIEEEAERRERRRPEKQPLRHVEMPPRVARETGRELFGGLRRPRRPLLADLLHGFIRDEHVRIAADRRNRSAREAQGHELELVGAVAADERELRPHLRNWQPPLCEKRLRRDAFARRDIRHPERRHHGHHRRPLHHFAVRTIIDGHRADLRVVRDRVLLQQAVRQRERLMVVRRDERLHEDDRADRNRHARHGAEMPRLHRYVSR